VPELLNLLSTYCTTMVVFPPASGTCPPMRASKSAMRIAYTMKSEVTLLRQLIDFDAP
jgi:hypothetical protein